jgi:hypothetical protein
MIASCERHGVDPQRYLTSVLAKIGQTPQQELGQFLPDVWKAEDAAEPSSTDACPPSALPPSSPSTATPRSAERTPIG